jgi:hypothetical protein
MEMQNEIRFHKFNLDKCGIHDYEGIKAMANKHIRKTTTFHRIVMLKKIAEANENLWTARTNRFDVDRQLSSLSVSLFNAYNVIKNPTLFKYYK